MAEKNCFDMTKLIVQIMSVTVAMVKKLLARAGKPGSTPATLFSVSLYRFFFLFGLFF